MFSDPVNSSEEEKISCLKKLLAGVTDKWQHLTELEPDESFDNIKQHDDTRECVSCRALGDDRVCGRLVPFDNAMSTWIHVNCLMCVEAVSLVDDYLVQDLQNLFAKQKTVLSLINSI